MPVQSYDNSPTTPTAGVGNAGGKPMLPILFGVMAVIALILITIALQKRPASVNADNNTNTNKASNAAGPYPATRYEPAPVAQTATGQIEGASPVALPPGPAVAPVGASGARTSVSGSSELPAASGGAGSGRNFVAPPGPAASGQEGAR